MVTLPRANVFVATTPFQYTMAEAVAEILDPSSREHHLVRTFEPFRRRRTWSSESVVVVPNGMYQRDKAREAYRIARALYVRIPAECDRVLIATNLEHTVVNPFYLAHQHAPGSSGRFEVLSEGILNMLSPRYGTWDVARWTLKFVVKKIQRVPYAFYAFDRAGTARASLIYAPTRPHLHSETPIQLVPLDFLRSERPPQDGVMVLGQPLEHFYGDGELKQVWSEMASVAEVSGSLRKVYKTHPTESGAAANFFQERGFRVLADRKPVEELFVNEPYSHVISVASSALIHLKAIYGSAVRCTAIRPSEWHSFTTYKVGTPGELCSLFTSHGVEILEKGHRAQMSEVV